MSDRFVGKNVLVTGANSGIGLAAAERFVSEGARVLIVGRDQAWLYTAVAQLGHDAVGIRADLAQQTDVERLFATVHEHVDRLDVVVANAGAGTYAPIGSFTEEQFHDRFSVNTKGAAFTVQGALPLIPRRRCGGIGRLDQRQQGTTGPGVLRSLQGGAAVVCANLDQ